MPQESRTSGVLRFNVFQVDLRAGELYKAGRKIKLQVQPLQVLAMLLERPGEVVTREELKQRLWPVDTFVDFDHSLNTAIKKVRQVLDDDAKKPRRPQPAKVPASPLIGRLARLRGENSVPFVLLAVDEEAAEEREKLDAANDDVGLSVLIASQRVLMVPTDTQVRVLEVRQPGSHFHVRILDGEHYGKTAVVPRQYLGDLS